MFYIFSKSRACLLIKLTLYFRGENFNFSGNQLIDYFFYTSCAFDVVTKKLSPNPRSSRFSPILSFKSFIILHFIAGFVIHYEFIFVKGVRFVTRFNFFTEISSCFSTLVGKRLPLLHCIVVAHLSKIIWYVGLFLGFLICSFNLLVHSLTIAHSHYCSFILSLDVR